MPWRSSNTITYQILLLRWGRALGIPGLGWCVHGASLPYRLQRGHDVEGLSSKEEGTKAIQRSLDTSCDVAMLMK